MTWLLVWCMSSLVCGVVCAAVASARKLQIGVWFVVGLSCNAIGVLLVAVAKPEDPPALTAPPAPTARPGWYDDPALPGRVRYHDGRQWTDRSAATGRSR